jgi:chromosomal replication initiation ATPase DnaA
MNIPQHRSQRRDITTEMIVGIGELPEHRPNAGHYDPDILRAFLLEAVERAFETDAAQLLAPTRGRASDARARQAMMYLAHVACGLTLTEVGRLFDRDRTTVAHACRVIEDCREDRTFDQAVQILESLLIAMPLAADDRWAV